LQCELNDDGIATDKMLSSTIEHLRKCGSEASSVHALVSGRDSHFIAAMKVSSLLLDFYKFILMTINIVLRWKFGDIMQSLLFLHSSIIYSFWWFSDSFPNVLARSTICIVYTGVFEISVWLYFLLLYLNLICQHSPKLTFPTGYNNRNNWAQCYFEPLKYYETWSIMNSLPRFCPLATPTSML